MPQPFAVLFDLDGTITDHRYGSRFSRAWSHLMTWAFYSKAQAFSSLLELFETVFIHFRPHFAPGIFEVLEALKSRGARVGIITDRTSLQVAHFLLLAPELDITQFDLIHTRRGLLDALVKFLVRSPIPHFTHPGMKNGRTLKPILEFLEREHQIPQDRVVYVGDNWVDIEAAEAAEISFLASTWGKRQPDDFRRRRVPDQYILRLPADLKQLFPED